MSQFWVFKHVLTIQLISHLQLTIRNSQIRLKFSILIFQFVNFDYFLVKTDKLNSEKKIAE